MANPGLEEMMMRQQLLMQHQNQQRFLAMANMLQMAQNGTQTTSPTPGAFNFLFPPSSLYLLKLN